MPLSFLGYLLKGVGRVIRRVRIHCLLLRVCKRLSCKSPIKLFTFAGISNRQEFYTKNWRIFTRPIKAMINDSKNWFLWKTFQTQIRNVWPSASRSGIDTSKMTTSKMCLKHLMIHNWHLAWPHLFQLMSNFLQDQGLKKLLMISVVKKGQTWL